MTAAQSLLTRGQSLLGNQFGKASFKHAGFTAKGNSTAIAESRELRDTGYWLAFQCVLEITRAEFVKLKVEAEKSVGTYTDADGEHVFPMRVTVIDGKASDGDPCVRLTLKREADAAPGQPAPER